MGLDGPAGSVPWDRRSGSVWPQPDGSSRPTWGPDGRARPTPTYLSTRTGSGARSKEPTRATAATTAVQGVAGPAQGGTRHTSGGASHVGSGTATYPATCSPTARRASTHHPTRRTRPSLSAGGGRSSGWRFSVGRPLPPPSPTGLEVSATLSLAGLTAHLAAAVAAEDQGFVVLLARHVDVPHGAWQKLQERLGGADGQFWQSGYTGGDFMRASHGPQGGHGAGREREEGASSDDEGETEGGKAEEGRAGQQAERKPRRSIYGLPLIQPYNLFAVLWTMSILLLDLTYTAFWVPMNVAFCTAQYGNLSSACTTSDLVGGILYFLNALLGFQIGVVATNGFRKRTVVDGRQVSWLYVRYGKFWLDTLASVPFIYLVVVLAGSSTFSLNKGWVNCLSLLRLLRMIRLVSISKVVYMDSMSGRFQESQLGNLMSVSLLYSLFLAYQLAVAINLFACIMVLCAYFEGYENSWMTAVDWADLPNASNIYQWFCAVYWMIVTATTTGFGDFAPRSTAEQVVANVVMMGGMIMFGVLVASIGNALSRAASEAFQAYASRQKILHVMEWAEHRQLPPDIRKQVQNFYADKYGRKEEESLDASVMVELPSRLRAKVARSLCVPLLAEVLAELPEQPDHIIGLLAENMRPIRLPAGEDLCQQGDVASCFWILQEGTVQAVRYKEGAVTVDASDVPRLLGESVLLGEAVEACRVRPWTLRTVTPCRLWGITLNELYPVMRMYPSIGTAAAEYVKDKAIMQYRGNSYDGQWCELAAIIVKQLQELPRDEAVDLLNELARAFAVDGSLQPVLERLLAFCATRRGPAVGGDPSVIPPSRRAAMAAAAAAAGGGGSSGGGNPSGPGGGNPSGGPGGAGGLSGAPSGGGAVQASAGRGRGHEVGTAVIAAPAAGSAFGTPAAAAALSAALGAVGSGGGAGGEVALSLPLPQQLVHLSGSGGEGGSGGGPANGVHGPSPGMLPAGANAAGTGVALYGGASSLISPSPLPGLLGASSGGGVAAPGTAVQCLGCQRCVCPSCGQGMDPIMSPPPGVVHLTGSAAVVAAAAASTLLYPGVNSRPTASPGMRAWAKGGGALRRMSIGVRQDQVWASERQSFDRRQLSAVSNMPYE